MNARKLVRILPLVLALWSMRGTAVKAEGYLQDLVLGEVVKGVLNAKQQQQQEQKQEKQQTQFNEKQQKQQDADKQAAISKEHLLPYRRAFRDLLATSLVVTKTATLSVPRNNDEYIWILFGLKRPALLSREPILSSPIVEAGPAN